MAPAASAWAHHVPNVANVTQLLEDEHALDETNVNVPSAEAKSGDLHSFVPILSKAPGGWEELITTYTKEALLETVFPSPRSLLCVCAPPRRTRRD